MNESPIETLNIMKPLLDISFIPIFEQQIEATDDPGLRYQFYRAYHTRLTTEIDVLQRLCTLNYDRDVQNFSGIAEMKLILEHAASIPYNLPCTVHYSECRS